MKHYRKVLTLLLALGMLAAVAGPASANAIGVFTGNATVGKNATFCNHDGTSNVTGAGIGIPVVNGVKNAFYSIDTDEDVIVGPVNLGPGSIRVVNTPDKGKGDLSIGRLQACGRLGPVGQDPAKVGAACGMSKGYHGKGKVTFTEGGKVGHDYFLQDITWKVTEGGTIILWANGNQGQPTPKGTKGADLVLGEIQAQGALPCTQKPTNKQNNDDVGAQDFTVAGAFEIINGAWVDPQDGTPGICKDSGPTCAYNDKKDPLPKS